MQNAQQMNSLDIDRIDNQIGQRCKHQFSRSLIYAEAPFHGEMPERFRRAVDAGNRIVRERWMMQFKITGDRFEIIRGCE